jgi:alanine racemase
LTTTPPLRALISADALRRNAVAALARGGAVADLRRDAWGHGLALVAPVLRAAGVVRAVVDAEALGEPALAGIDADTTADAADPIDPALLLGLPGSGGMPVMELRGRVLSLKPLLAGEGVSYNYTHRATRDTRIALVTGGFGQGVARSLGNHVRVGLGDMLAPIVGRVAMDVCVVDVDALPVAPGDPVVYFGGTGPARDGLSAWADASGLAPAELAAAIGFHARREAA